MRRSRVIASVVSGLLASLCSAWAAPGEPAPPRPTSADSGWLQTAGDQIRRDEYHLSAAPGGDGWSAPNRAHDLRTTWSDGRLEVRPRVEGGDWAFRYQLLSVGRPGDEAEAAAPVTSEWLDPGRLEWARGDVREWYVNDERGLEQGFVIARRPRTRARTRAEDEDEEAGEAVAGDGDETVTGEPLVIDGLIEGLLAYPSEDAASVLLRTAQGKDVLHIRDLRATDARGQELAACFAVGDGVLRIVVDDHDAVYPVTVDPLLTGPAWTVESNKEDAELGYSVATAGDVNGDGFSDVIVGAPSFDNVESDRGRAFVYLGSASGLSTTAAWMAEGNHFNTRLGSSVASAGDVNGDGFGDVIVGAPGFRNPESFEGGAFVYHGSPTGLSTTPAWTAESNQEFAEFGVSVAAGDVNGDGFSDVIVGAYKYDNGQTDEGRAFVYHGSPSGLSASAAWTAESNQEAAWLGISVATAGDVNGDGFSDVIVGANQYDNGQTNEGRAFLYHGSPSGLSTTAAWTAESNQVGADFGISVATAGDVNGDGYGDAIVGASDFGNGQSDEGRAFVYHGSASGLSATAAWTAESNEDFARLGYSVATAGDINGDGYADVIVGAYFTNAAFVYAGSPSGLSATAVSTVEGNQDSLGQSVATAGDVNGDGFSDVIIGAPIFSNPEFTEGRALVYHGSPSGLALAPGWTRDGNQVDARLGLSVATAGDVNGDGYSDVIVGVPLYDNGETDEGRALVYHGSASGPVSVPSWSAEGNQAGAQFGASVGTAGDVNADGYSDVIVGAPLYSNGQTNEGRAFAYHGSPSGLATTAAWTAESDQAGARLGTSVATAGDVNGDGFNDVIVGAPFFDNGETDEGRILVYHGSSSGLAATAAATREPNRPADFGFSVGTAGDVNRDGFSDVVIGAPFYANGQTDEGAVYVYKGASAGIGATPQRVLESNQAGAQLGWSVGTAGDVNGDGFSDVVAGAPLFDNGETDEGRAFLFQGSSSGIPNQASRTLEGNQAGAQFGTAVGTAGDVNGDGFSDVVVGAPIFNNGEQNEGRAFVYHGSASGLAAAAAWTAEGNQLGARFGAAVGAAGDVNGDGYGDVLVGAPFVTRDLFAEGEVSAFLGNGGDGLDRIVRAAQTPGTPPIDLLDRTPENRFRVLANGRTPFGRGKVRLETEVRPLASAFDGTGLGIGPFTDTGAPGPGGSVAALGFNPVALSTPGMLRWRARLRTLAPFPWQSPWMSPPRNAPSEGDLRTLPADLVISALAAPTISGAGKTMTVNETTKNQGSGTAAATTTRFWLSLDSTLDANVDTPFGQRSVPQLGPGQQNSGNTSGLVPSGWPTGTSFVIAQADGANAVKESNETNNLKTKAIKIGPDLQVSTLGAPTSAARGAIITVSDTTKDLGGGDDPVNTQTAYYLSTDSTLDAGDVKLGFRTVPPLLAGAGSSGSASVVIPIGTVPGSYFIIAAADDRKVLVETIETNNTKAKAITIN